MEHKPLCGCADCRQRLADKLMRHGLITTPEQYMLILSTGVLEPMV